ncbi:hypothetical protein [Paenibacillus elgii]|uniref:hypothetical protein n=1 Tax=Paenibacillus elgii TaxID=189691 RepID=UPI000248D794|nr:hypothetical protein [Paenibacillus elgii]
MSENTDTIKQQELKRIEGVIEVGQLQCFSAKEVKFLLELLQEEKKKHTATIYDLTITQLKLDKAYQLIEAYRNQS